MNGIPFRDKMPDFKSWLFYLQSGLFEASYMASRTPFLVHKLLGTALLIIEDQFPYLEGKERPKKEAGPSRLVGVRFNKPP